MHDETHTLEESVRAAVAHVRAELTKLDDLTDSLVETIMASSSTRSAGSASAARLDDYLRTFIRDLRRHLEMERDTLGSFNIVFFGRTGTGKSTLMSAFGELDGSYVSPGASDWTTDVHYVGWHDCRLFDTPGINGWGRTETRDNLEATARRAVETADLVLLCFDSQNQQAMEFSKIAAWIRDFGKPAVAVLNVRNPRWRHPALVREERRRNLSDAVRQHADNIATELAQIGLAHTPVVAVQSRRALFARAATPFQGTAVESFTHDRAEFGTEYLARWSNFATLERLLSTAIEEGASDIRLSALREDVRARYRTAAADLEVVANEFLTNAENARDRAESLIAVIGYPTQEERSRFLTAEGTSADLIAKLEELQGAAFNSPVKGSLDRFVRHQSKSRLAAQRRQSTMNAKQCVENAFNQKTTIDTTAFAAAVYDDAAVTSAFAGIWRARNEFLARELSATEDRDLAVDLDHLTSAASFAGIGGGGVGNALRGGGIATGLAAIAVPLAWNPAGWAAGAAAVGIGVASQVQQHFGKKMTATAHKKMSDARAQAIADADSAVHKTYDAYDDALRLNSRESAWESLGPLVARCLADGIDLRKAHRRANDLVNQINLQATSIAAVDNAGEVLSRAQTSLAETPAERMTLLLGEDWIPSDDEHREETPINPAVRSTYADQSAQNQAALAAVISDAWNSPSLSAIRAWTSALQDASWDDTELRNIEREMRRIRGDKPVFAVLGDYNSGKTSLLRRILVEEGDPSGHDNLEILAHPATASAKRYEFPRFDLVDTPGLQSGNTSHDDTALHAIASASLILVVVHVNLLIGNTRLLEEIAVGTAKLAARGHRMIFLINRADELGADPLVEPGAFLSLQERKKYELVAALSAKSIPFDKNRIHCIASDPFGMVGSATAATAAEFDENRFWDGTSPLISAITSISDDDLNAMRATAGFDFAIDLLKRYRSTLTADLAAVAESIADCESALLTLASAGADAELLQKSITDNAEQTISIGVADAGAKVYKVAVGDTASLNNVVNSWTDGPQLRSAIDRYAKETERELRDWQDEHASMIEREFRGTNQIRNSKVAGTFSAGQAAGAGQALNGAGAVAGVGAKFAKALGNRDAVYAIGKLFGHKFKPWGAVKGGARVAKFGAVLGAAAAAADAAAMANDSKKAKAHRTNQSSAISTIDAHAVQLLNLLTDGEDADGPAAFLASARSAIGELADETTNKKTQLMQVQEELGGRAATVDRLLARADNLKNHTQEETPR